VSVVHSRLHRHKCNIPRCWTLTAAAAAARDDDDDDDDDDEWSFKVKNTGLKVKVEDWSLKVQPRSNITDTLIHERRVSAINEDR